MARWRKPTPPPSTLRRAAQYVRMSTEHQQYSIANQSAAIALYGAAHKIGIVRSFVDAGKIGTTIKRRVGLQELLRIVESGSADFTDVLVYDVSRWGRFPDCDESAHYDFGLIPLLVGDDRWKGMFSDKPFIPAQSPG